MVLSLAHDANDIPKLVIRGARFLEESIAGSIFLFRK
jgi:hypothetical protein